MEPPPPPPVGRVKREERFFRLKGKTTFDGELRLALETRKISGRGGREGRERNNTDGRAFSMTSSHENFLGNSEMEWEMGNLVFRDECARTSVFDRFLAGATSTWHSRRAEVDSAGRI